MFKEDILDENREACDCLIDCQTMKIINKSEELQSFFIFLNCMAVTYKQTNYINILTITHY